MINPLDNLKKKWIEPIDGKKVQLIHYIPDVDLYVGIWKTPCGDYKPYTYKLHHLEEVSPYVDIPIDTKVLVWDSSSEERYKRYFAGVNKQGKPQAFNNGQTSWTQVGATDWDYCKVVDDD